MALSYFSYYLISFIWGLFFRRFYSPVFFIALIFHIILYQGIFGRDTFTKLEFSTWVPITIILGAIIGHRLATVLNARRLIFLKHIHRYAWWFTLVIIEVVFLHLILVFWETPSVFTRPWNYITTFLLYFIVIPAFYFLNRRQNIWEYTDVTDGNSKKRDDYAAELFHLYWFLFHMFTVLVFGIVQWVDSDASFWPFYTVLIVFGVQLITLIIMRIAANNWRCKLVYQCRESGGYFIKAQKHANNGSGGNQKSKKKSATYDDDSDHPLSEFF